MTRSQDKKYWRRWAACARVNRWTSARGRLHSDALLAASEHHCKVHAAALQLAARSATAVTPELLRHACHIVALGHDKSHTDFSNKEFDSLLNYWGDERKIRGLLLDPVDLAATIHQANPALKTRERLLLALRRDFREAYIANVAHTMAGTRDWEQLPDAKLAALHALLQDRPNAKKAKGERLKAETTESETSALSLQPSDLSSDPF